MQEAPHQKQNQQGQNSHRPLNRYEVLLSQYANGGLKDLTAFIDLFQYLLDTDKIHHMSDQMRRTADYLVTEGYCYYVPSQDMGEQQTPKQT